MTPIDIITLFIATLGLIIAVFLKRPVVRPRIVFKATKRRHLTLEQSIAYVKKRDAERLKGRDKKGRFA